MIKAESFPETEFGPTAQTTPTPVPCITVDPPYKKQSVFNPGWSRLSTAVFKICSGSPVKFDSSVVNWFPEIKTQSAGILSPVLI